MIPVIDLHCDLLGYLGGDKSRTTQDVDVRCALPQLKEGNVCLQVMAIYTETKQHSSSYAQQQIAAFERLFSAGFAPFRGERTFSTQEVHVLPAIENASGLCEEEEDVSHAIKRLEALCQRIGKPLYISLTWNTENRFGGGNYASAGLKPEGRALLEYLDGSGICIDLSHTSDALAEDILNVIIKENLKIVPIASHSNFRHVVDHPRNLPDEIALEIKHLKGVIGVNLVRAFLGDPLKQLERARSLGLLDHLCMGADFFYDDTTLPDPHALRPFYYDAFQNASCYPALFQLFRSQLSEDELVKVANRNFLHFLERRGTP